MSSPPGVPAAGEQPVTANGDIAAALPDYEIGGELGRGGFGVVLTGRHRHLQREVAIKELPPALATDPKVRARFAAEARVLASLSHPHIVPIYDYVERDGLCLLVMEKLPGGTVWSHFTARGFTVETTCAIVMAACAGLHYAHQRGVLHRDIKPENLLFSSDRVLKVTDFGIAKVVGGSETLATRGGEILGTPAYMAPEQAEGRELGPAADVFASGVMLYELLSGKLPYSAEGGALAMVYRHVYEDAIPLLDVAPDVAPPLADVTMRALARSPEARYSTAEELGVALGEAATAVWGPQWLERSEVQIVDPGPISESAKRPSGRVPPSDVRPGAGAGPAPSGPASGGVPPPPSAHTVRRVRPEAAEHVAGAAPVDIDQVKLVPVRDVIELPPPPSRQVAAALALVVLVLVVALIGLGEPPRSAAFPPGTVTVGGSDPAEGRVTLDLAKPVEVRVRGQLPGSAPGRVQLGFSVAGVPLVSSSSEVLTSTDGDLVAAVRASANRYLVAGEMTGELRLLGEDGVVARHEFPVRSMQPDFVTVPGVFVVGLLLFLLAYVESLLRPLRRGRHQVAGVGGMLLVGAAFGVVAVPFVSLLGGQEPKLTTAVACAVLGTGAGAAAAVAAIRAGRRARLRPKVVVPTA
jgi:serine/threonine-protein kinase